MPKRKEIACSKCLKTIPFKAFTKIPMGVRLFCSEKCGEKFFDEVKRARLNKCGKFIKEIMGKGYLEKFHCFNCHTIGKAKADLYGGLIFLIICPHCNFSIKINAEKRKKI